MMRRSAHYACSALAAIAAIAVVGCTSGAVGEQPDIQITNVVANSKLQFAVGTATINAPSIPLTFIGLNAVETLRQPNGLSAVLLDTPYITGPPAFVGQANPITDTPSNVISGSGPGISCALTTFGCGGGAFGYGFANENTLSTSSSLSFQLFSLPIAVGGSNEIPNAPYYSGPPAFPQFNNGSYPAGFLGYSPGFTAFQTPPVLGSYQLSVVIPTSGTTSVTINQNATLNTTTPLPVMQQPQAFPDPNNPGGLLIDVVVPAGVTETWVWIEDAGQCYPHSSGNSLGEQYYTVRTTQSGAQQLALPPNLGPTNGSGTTPTICSAAQNQAATGNPNATGDIYRVYAAGFDYPAYSAAYPFNNQQTPAFVGANGQVDVTLTEPENFQYP
ncbi:MAG TPA: hypothetical protein VEJ20_00665 [Candidatus Eremiobacteraceae bacterium]|nr:hypothetical protein [Candidatus Eremiobacteraceae bacterium]